MRSGACGYFSGKVADFQLITAALDPALLLRNGRCDFPEGARSSRGGVGVRMGGRRESEEAELEAPEERMKEREGGRER